MQLCFGVTTARDKKLPRIVCLNCVITLLWCRLHSISLKKKIKVGLPPEGEKRNTSVNLGAQGPVASFTSVSGSISELHFEKY